MTWGSKQEQLFQALLKQVFLDLMPSLDAEKQSLMPSIQCFVDLLAPELANLCGCLFLAILLSMRVEII
ncbi:CLUMA_CG007422, isoform A [Clunio marinus]|uniref:CLUMA_CG007422, isoform A n=1 Tax=Clunio marinus TaxID=568069 RepID=A0A1J1I0M1_9DIPT|nr:CLUMA_CG007422, isoform A [Clunio marinus]